MGLSAYWNTSNIFEFFVATNQELKEMRDRIFRAGRSRRWTRSWNWASGSSRSLEQCRERHTQQVIDALSPTAPRSAPSIPARSR